MYKQDILCKFLININLISKKSKRMHRNIIRLHNLYIWQSLQTLSRHKRTKRRKIPKQVHIELCFCCVYPFWGQCATPSVFLLFEEKLQRRVPLISWEAVRQLAVIQRLGNFAQKEKNKYIIPLVQQKSFYPSKCGKNRTFTKTSLKCAEGDLSHFFLLMHLSEKRTCLLCFVVWLICSTVL